MKLGFHPPLFRLYVFIKNEADALWYYLNGEQKYYIRENAITGTLKSLTTKEVKTSFGSEIKADFELIADRPYVLRSGVDTAFTKGLLMMIAAVSDDQLKKPITLELQAGKEKGNVLVSGRHPETFEPVRTGTWGNADWDGLIRSAQTRLGGESLTISQSQYNDLLVASKKYGYTKSNFGELIGRYGFSKGSEITQSALSQLLEEIAQTAVF